MTLAHPKGFDERTPWISTGKPMKDERPSRAGARSLVKMPLIRAGDGPQAAYQRLTDEYVARQAAVKRVIAQSAGVDSHRVTRATAAGDRESCAVFSSRTRDFWRDPWDPSRRPSLGGLAK
jgi:hypothetical protein